MSELPCCAYCRRAVKKAAARTCGSRECIAKACSAGSIHSAEQRRNRRPQRDGLAELVVDFSPFNIEPPDDIGTAPMRPPTVVSRQASS